MSEINDNLLPSAGAIVSSHSMKELRYGIILQKRAATDRFITPLS